MNIGVDVDEVLSDTISEMLAFHNDRFGTALSKDDCHSYEFSNILGVSHEETERRYKEFLESEYFKRVQPLPEAIGVLSGWRKNGHKLFIISARQNYLRADTEKWLETHYPSIFSEVHTTDGGFGRPDGATKSSVCLALGVKIMIEDNIKHALDCAGAGVKVILLDYPWNKRSDLPKSIIRVGSWRDVTVRI